MKTTALDHKLAACVWWLLAQLEAAVVTFLSKTERRVGARDD